MTKRLTEKQKEKIVQSFVSGNSIDFLSREYSCSKLTITRNLKKNLGELKYKDLINKKKSLLGKAINKDIEFNNESDANQNNKDSKKLDKSQHFDIGSNFSQLESFFEIAPLDYQIENSSRKEISSVPIQDIEFPNVVYMVVNKNIELEIKLLKDYPDWEFLPSEDLKRKTIEIYFDLKSAKRGCNKEQKVIKVPNTDVFRIVSPILKSRGITRIVSAEKLIAL